MLKKYILPMVMLAGSILCGLLYIIHGQTIDADGILHEAFGFIPLAWLFFFAALISFLVIRIIKRKKI